MKLKRIIVNFLCILLYSVLYISCSEKNEDLVPDPVVSLKADRNYLKSNGIDAVTFTVDVDGTDASNSSVIHIKGDPNTTISGTKFSTNVPGSYTFYATHGLHKSPEIQVDASAVVVLMTADTASIKANGIDIVTFSVTEDGTDVSDKATIIRRIDENDNSPLTDNTFSTKKPGIYSFYATYGDYTSPDVQINATVYLKMRADTTSIKANGKDAVTFTVTADEDDITQEAEIMLIEDGNAIKIDSNVFVSNIYGNYEFFAQYDDMASDTVSIEVLNINLLITADRTTVSTNESITVTAISGETTDVTSEIVLHVVHDDTDEIIDGNTFTPSSFGSYTIFAVYDDVQSNSIDIEVLPANITLSVDKDQIIASGTDSATFTVSVDGKSIDDAVIYIKDYMALPPGYKFSSFTPGTYIFYAQFGDIKSEDVVITVNSKFFKQSVAMEAVATWCGYSPQMMQAFFSVHKNNSDKVQIMSIHPYDSDLGSSDVKTEDFIDFYNIGSYPFGIVDLDEKLYSRTPEAVLSAHNRMKYIHPVAAGIAIESQKYDDNISITLKIKAYYTHEYSVCAVIVEDSIIKPQRIYPNNSMALAYYDSTFMHFGVATYTMPDAPITSGKSLGTIEAGQEVTESFSIATNRVVTSKRTINYSNCRVVAYIMRKEGDKYYINNANTCPVVDGYVDYKYEQ
ncbi:MAG: Omp28-related outer membrane protein [Tannerella sp.]|jgi:hypothetical protein|nr:Omp28-related outer membrane protein [Tannerella sp.]